MIRSHGRRRPLPLATLLLVFAAASVAGCAAGDIPRDGFLKDTSKLRTTPYSQEMLVQFDESLDDYRRFTMAPLEMRFEPQRPRPVAFRDASATEVAYRAAVLETLTRGGRFEEANAPGRGVMIVRAAVTDRFQRDATEPAPGPATLELEAVDSLSKKRVFAVIDPSLGAKDSGGEHTTPQDAFARFARRLRMRLDEARPAAAGAAAPAPPP